MRFPWITSACNMGLSASLADLYDLAIVKIDRRLQNDLVAWFDTFVDLNLSAEVSGDRNFVQIGSAVLGNGDLHAVLIEDDRRRWYDQRQRRSRDMQLD